MRRSIIALGAGLLLSLSATSISANPVMPLGALAASVAAETDDAVTPVRWRHCYRWHCRHYRHYGWYRGRHYGWYRYHRGYRAYGRYY